MAQLTCFKGSWAIYPPFFLSHLLLGGSISVEGEIPRSVLTMQALMPSPAPCPSWLMDAVRRPWAMRDLSTSLILSDVHQSIFDALKEPNSDFLKLVPWQSSSSMRPNSVEVGHPPSPLVRWHFDWACCCSWLRMYTSQSYPGQWEHLACLGHPRNQSNSRHHRFHSFLLIICQDQVLKGIHDEFENSFVDDMWQNTQSQLFIFWFLIQHQSQWLSFIHHFMLRGPNGHWGKWGNAGLYDKINCTAKLTNQDGVGNEFHETHHLNSLIPKHGPNWKTKPGWRNTDLGGRDSERGALNVNDHGWQI